MPVSKKPRKKHRKVYALVNPIEHAIAGAAITDTARLDSLRTRELSALEAFTHGKATRIEWMDLADMANVAETMARRGTGPEVLTVCEHANLALRRTHARFKSLGVMALDGPGLQVLRDLYEYHDLQRSSVSRAEYERCIKLTADRIRGAAPDVKVLV